MFGIGLNTTLPLPLILVLSFPRGRSRTRLGSAISAGPPSKWAGGEWRLAVGKREGGKSIENIYWSRDRRRWEDAWEMDLTRPVGVALAVSSVSRRRHRTAGAERGEGLILL